MTKFLKLVDGTDVYQLTEEKVFKRGGKAVEVTNEQAEYLLSFPFHTFKEVESTTETKEEAKSEENPYEVTPVSYAP